MSSPVQLPSSQSYNYMMTLRTETGLMYKLACSGTFPFPLSSVTVQSAAERRNLGPPSIFAGSSPPTAAPAPVEVGIQ